MIIIIFNLEIYLDKLIIRGIKHINKIKIKNKIKYKFQNNLLF